jgi:NAD(P)-dependent dehydrogenase (short-subunit alcohol dehydrogenase family)
MHLDLSGKKIIVTGANSGIGFAISESLLKSGASVALHHNSGKKGIELLLKKYKNATYFQADLSETENCISFFEKIENQFGKIDMWYKMPEYLKNTQPKQAMKNGSKPGKKP